jgi:ABC-type nitrate/sulfonate/bicarbonate transport system permease component
VTESVTTQAATPAPSTPPASVPPARPSLMRRLFTLREPTPPLIKRSVGFTGVGLAVLVWFLITLGATPETRLVSPVVLPSPGEVLRGIPTLFTERALVASTAATLRRVLTGFGLAIIVGVPLGILAGAYRLFDALTGPISVFLRNIPVAVLIPLTILWFGIDETQKTMFIFIATAPFVFFDAARAVAGVPERYVETAQTLGASSGQIVMKVLIPLAMPDIYNSLRNLFGLAFGYIMLAELVNAEHGLGYLLMTSQRRGLTEHIFGILIVIGLLAYGIDRLLYWFQRGLFPHRTDED